jgi:alpha-D-ribose 1-methylphosphonate 5-triphosphate synthase subunit PhnH
MSSVALITEPSHMPRLDQFRFGDEDGTETPVLLIVQVEGFLKRDTGIYYPLSSRRRAHFTPAGFPEYFWTDWKAQGNSYPLGIEVLLTWRDVLVAMMRWV